MMFASISPIPEYYGPGASFTQKSDDKIIFYAIRKTSYAETFKIYTRNLKNHPNHSGIAQYTIMPPGKIPVRRRSTLDVDFAMDKQPPPAPGGIFNVVIIGAGGINFGSIEGGPWNHSFRLEHKVATLDRIAINISSVQD
jgi:hypothetical protein